MYLFLQKGCQSWRILSFQVTDQECFLLIYSLHSRKADMHCQSREKGDCPRTKMGARTASVIRWSDAKAICHCWPFSQAPQRWRLTGERRTLQDVWWDGKTSFRSRKPNWKHWPLNLFAWVAYHDRQTASEWGRRSFDHKYDLNNPIILHMYVIMNFICVWGTVNSIACGCCIVKFVSPLPFPNVWEIWYGDLYRVYVGA